MPLRVAFLIMLSALAASCVNVIDERPYGIWIQEPMFSLGDPDHIAEKHCAKYGRTAVKTGTLGSGAAGENYLPVLAYGCE